MAERSFKPLDLAIWACRLLVAGTFIYAAYGKILDPVGFAEDIRNYQALPYELWNLSAGIVPMVELLAGIVLLTGFREHGRKAAAAVLGVLTCMFLVLIASVIIRDIDITCGCFGKAEEAKAVGWPLFLRDIALLGAVGVSWLSTAAEKAKAAASPAQPSV